MALAQPRLRPGGLSTITAPTTRSSTPYAAVLWDMDGTLVDTEPYWIDTEFALAERFGGTWSREHALRLVGRDLMSSGHYIREHMGFPADLDLSAERIVELLLDGVVARVREEVPWRPGARELLEALRSDGTPCALVTMSYQRFVDPILEHLPPDTFAAVVTGDRVTHGKPHPEAYLTAARLLDVEARDCLAVEDSPPGAASADAAGCTVLVVPLHVEVPSGPSRVFRESLAGLGPADLPAPVRAG